MTGFWRSHLLWPAVAMAILLIGVQMSGFDVWLVDHFWDAASGRFPARDGWWAHDLLHAGGKRFVYLIALVWAVVWLAGWWPDQHNDWKPWRRAAGFVLLAMLLVPTIVGGLKQVSDSPCPDQARRYGGEAALVPWFGRAEQPLPGIGCSPGAHSSSAFALFAVYFVYRRARPRLARLALVGAAGLGGVFAFAQSARGAHFLTHDLLSAAIAWATCLALYSLVWRRHLHPADARAAPY